MIFTTTNYTVKTTIFPKYYAAYTTKNILVVANNTCNIWWDENEKNRVSCDLELGHFFKLIVY